MFVHQGNDCGPRRHKNYGAPNVSENGAIWKTKVVEEGQERRGVRRNDCHVTREKDSVLVNDRKF